MLKFIIICILSVLFVFALSFFEPMHIMYTLLTIIGGLVLALPFLLKNPYELK